MSPEKLQALLAKLDELKLAAEDAAKELGMSAAILAPFFMRPMPPSDWLLELAKTGPKNPGLINFMAENMRELPPARAQGSQHYGPNADAKLKRKGATKTVSRGKQAA